MNYLCISAEQFVLPVLGLDVAKASVQAELRTKERKVRFDFANNAKGFAQLARVLDQQGAPKIWIWAGLEATGAYSQALALWLHAQGHRVSLLNPRRVKQYAQSAGRRNKTDLLDAAIIADFVCAMKPAPWQPPTLEVAQLQALVRRREELSVMLQAEKNRLEGLLAEMARPGQVERARQAAAHAGLVPRREQSGSSVRRNRGLGREGNRYLRKALYMPALVAIKYNAPLSHFASRLRSAGKPKMSIVCAVMRKLIHIAFGVLKHQPPLNPSLA